MGVVVGYHHNTISSPNRTPRSTRSGFSLIDLLVSISVIAVLIGLISPALSRLQDSARKLVCASNLNQVGLVVSMYQDDHDGRLPGELDASYRTAGSLDPQLAHAGTAPDAWNGLGRLVEQGYLTTPGVLYCPAHQGEHTAESYADAWVMLDSPIRTNYPYRASLAAPFAGASAATLPSERTILASDSFLSLNEISHANGFNTLSLGLSVSWNSNSAERIQTLLQTSASQSIDPDAGWSILEDDGTNGPEEGPDPVQPNRAWRHGW